ncbi:hypothetical protein SCHPADRAFT_1002335 [Schizopora paradoxa]|uniref:F-box domain-containing protein n=1 Tax=Schizopora paradoxa TaxID=27342 RepID=A0A0H2R555_9AGAM|nr:hypothetical protein SCHPADRAFT_1002335 [Schizopora paradoxa]
MAPRKRLKETRADASDASSSAAVAPERKPGKRRQNASGKGSFLLGMPTEIIMEIASYAFPEDILSLARASVGLRRLLMSKSSKYAWKSARTLHNLPQCPSDMSEPQLIDLLFGKGCSFCPETRTRKPLIELRVRACKECFEKHIAIMDDVLRRRRRSMPSNVDIYAMVPNLRLLTTAHGDKRGRTMAMTVGADLRRVLEQVDALSSRPEELEVYIEKRERLTEACCESSQNIASWLRKSSREKDRSIGALKKERRSSIMRKLLALGYNAEDLNSRYDIREKQWKWDQLLNQTRPLSERVWENIKPQLEETIQLRRQYVGHRFHADRRKTRQEEMTTRLVKFRPQLQDLPYEKLFLNSDLLALTVVKDMVEENDCRIKLTDERWNRVTNVLFEEVRKLGKTIENDCLHEIAKAIEEASKTIDTRLSFWKNNVDQGDEDVVPTRFLSATSLLNRRKSTALYSYAELLKDRTTPPFFRMFEKYRIAWAEETFTSSGRNIIMALKLLEKLRLSPETSMAYMLSLGKTFGCLQCEFGRGSLPMSWSGLVSHFIEQNETFELLTQKNIELNASVPLQNDHDVDSKALGDLVIRVHPPASVELLPTSEIGSRYSELSISWGVEKEYDVPDIDTDYVPEKKEFCKLCEKLKLSKNWNEWLPVDHMREHMRAKHGTDLEGNPLPEKLSATV